MWIVVLLIAGFVVWHFLPQADPSRPSPRFRREMRGTESDPDWIKYFEQHCESPAEKAFLRAMVEAYDLRPADGSLTGAGLQLDFQVEESFYRVDFLADRWLIVEIDGAAYHSSQDARARDEARDQHLESLGYSVLRIPAKVVFNTPADAVQRVRSALRVGRRSVPAPVQKSGWQRLSETMSSINDGVAQINANVSRKLAVERSLEEAKRAFDTEKLVIESAVATAKIELTNSDWLKRQDQQTKAIFEEELAFLEQAVANDGGAPQIRRAKVIEVRPFPGAPATHENSEYNLAIQQGYEQITKTRATFLEAQRTIVSSHPQLPSLVEKNLEELGCAKYWRLVGSADCGRPSGG